MFGISFSVFANCLLHLKVREGPTSARLVEAEVGSPLWVCLALLSPTFLPGSLQPGPGVRVSGKHQAPPSGDTQNCTKLSSKLRRPKACRAFEPVPPEGSHGVGLPQPLANCSRCWAPQLVFLNPLLPSPNFLFLTSQIASDTLSRAVSPSWALVHTTSPFLALSLWRHLCPPLPFQPVSSCSLGRALGLGTPLELHLSSAALSTWHLPHPTSLPTLTNLLQFSLLEWLGRNPNRLQFSPCRSVHGHTSHAMRP